MFVAPNLKRCQRVHDMQTGPRKAGGGTGREERKSDKPCVSDMLHNSGGSEHRKREPMGDKQKRPVEGGGRQDDVGECRSYHGRAQWMGGRHMDSPPRRR